MRRILPALAVAGLLAAALCRTPAAAQSRKLTPAQAAMMGLDGARRAHNDGKHALAAGGFRTFLQSYPTHAEAPSAWYGLGMALLEADPPDCRGAAEALKNVIARPDFADRPFAIYYMGVAARGQGSEALAKALADPAQARNHRSYANQYFAEASRHFAAADDAFAARAKASAATTAPAVRTDVEWAARARCDWCDMLLRTGQTQQAAELAGAFLATPAAAASRFRGRMLYYLGYARFTLKDTLGAGRALSALAPFAQEYGPHARYLLARTHHLSSERPEAGALYKALLAGHAKALKAAAESLKNPSALSPADKRRAEALTTGAPPDIIVRATFYAALLDAEAGRFADAQGRFAAFVATYPASPLAGEAKLRQGYCHLQLRSYAEAIKTLDPLRTDKQLGERAIWWLARARVAGADRAKPDVYAQTLKTAITELTKAAELARQRHRYSSHPDTLRGDIMLELGDTQQLAAQYKEAAATYQRVLSERLCPGRNEETTQRLATALHLNGDYRQSDQTCDSFEKAWPQSTLLAAIWFRKAENACMGAMALRASRSAARRDDVERELQKAIDRYRRLLVKFPDFAQADMARYGMATAQYELQRYDQALATLEAIDEGNRVGELVAVSYLMADCHIRLLPARTETALPAANLMDRATRAAKLLEGFLAAAPKSPLAPDALLKIGHCHQRIADVMAAAAERTKSLTQAKGAYERLLQLHPKDPLAVAAVFERAKCRALLGDTQTAMDELGQFRRDPYRAAAVAKLALVRLASLLRAKHNPVEAARILHEYRTWHKQAKHGDEYGRRLGAPFQYAQALALKESGKLAEARTIFEAVAKHFAGTPEGANALWRSVQCAREELTNTMAAYRTLKAQANANADQLSAAQRAASRSLTDLYKAADLAKAQGEAFAKTARGSEAHLRAIYEAAWCYRTLGDVEVDSARDKLASSAVEHVQKRWAGKQSGEKAPPLSAPSISRRNIPVQASETAADQQYAALIAAGPLTPLAVLGRFELAEMLADRGQDAGAVELLEAAIECSPPAELAQQVRLRLAACLLTGNRAADALAQIDLVGDKAAGALAGEMRFLSGEAYMQQKNWAMAIARLLPFNTTEPFTRMPGISDRALLRLGHAYAEAGKWPESRQAMETCVARFPRSPWIHEARFGVGWAWQNQKSTNNAISTYTQVVRGTAAKVAARARLQIGLCYMRENKHAEAVTALLGVPYTYDYPDCSAQAMVEAGRAYVALKEPDKAAETWRRVVKDYPASEWARTAKQQLSTLPPKKK